MDGMWISACVFAVAFIASAAHDPRKFRTGLYLVGAIASGALMALSEVLHKLALHTPELANWAIVALALGVMVTIVLLGALLVFNGIVVLRRERRSLAHALSLLVGLLLLGFTATGVVAVSRQWTGVVLVLFIILFPATYAGMGMITYVFYSWVYRMLGPLLTRRVDAVVVLGAGLAEGWNVTPLLAGRLDRALSVYGKVGAGTDKVLLVASGGQGENERRPEAEAMGEYLLGHGVNEDLLLKEDRSKNTAQNLRYSSELLRSQGFTGPIAAVTNNYHVLRTAMLMRQSGIAGYATGSRVATYYWPSAALREFVAICMGHRLANAIGLLLTCLPILASVAIVLLR
jgi:uncharacterized SAM-binding protein YcdF (DUF218 family)